MKLLILFLLVLVGAVSIALIVREDPGYVLIGYGDWTLETTLALLVVALLITFVSSYYGLRFLANLWQLPHHMKSWRQHRHARHAHKTLNKGLIQLAEGHWQDAEKTLLKDADSGDNPLLHYLGAARAAQQQGAHERRDHYLHLAHESMPAADVAVGLTQAELQIAHCQMEQALATLTHLRSIAPHHVHVLKLLMKLYRDLKDWPNLRELLPELRKRHVIKPEELESLERQVYKETLDQAVRKGGLDALRDTWGGLSRTLRHNESLALCYARHLMAGGADEEAESLVRETLKKTWSDKLAYLYGLLTGPSPAQQLSTAEGWLNEQPRNAVLLLTLGRLALRAKLWGKARSFLEASIGAGPRPEAYRELGALLQQLGDDTAAMKCYEDGMNLAASQNPLLSMSANGNGIKERTNLPATYPVGAMTETLPVSEPH